MIPDRIGEKSVFIGYAGDAFTLSDCVVGHSLLPKSFPDILIELGEGHFTGTRPDNVILQLPGPVLSMPEFLIVYVCISPFTAGGILVDSPFVCHNFTELFKIYQKKMNLTSGFSELFMRHSLCDVLIVCIEYVYLLPDLAAGGISNSSISCHLYSGYNCVYNTPT